MREYDVACACVHKHSKLVREEMASIDYETGSENESGRNDEDQPGPSKRAKLTKFKGAAVYHTKFNAWTKEHPK